MDYSLKYTGLYGIWAGLDWYERAELQDEMNMPTTAMLDTFQSSLNGYIRGEQE
jgi:hypothetical protein